MVENFYMRAGALKHDPQEDNPEKGPIIKKAAKKATQLIYKKHGLRYYRRGIEFEIWAEQKRILKEEGIDWKTPKEMNPKVIFD